MILRSCSYQTSAVNMNQIDHCTRQFPAESELHHLKPAFSFFFFLFSSRKLPVSGSGSVKSLTGCFYSCCGSERLNSSCFLSHMHLLSETFTAAVVCSFTWRCHRKGWALKGGSKNSQWKECALINIYVLWVYSAFNNIITNCRV